MKKKYDLIIYGSSLEDLLVANIAAKNGISTLIIEETDKIGGINKSVNINKYVFDVTSPFFTNLGTNENPGFLLKKLKELDINVDYKIDTNIFSYILSNSSNIRKIIKNVKFDPQNIPLSFEKVAPGSISKINEILSIAKEYYEILSGYYNFEFESVEFNTWKKKYPKAYKFIEFSTNDLFNYLKISSELRYILNSLVVSFGEFSSDLPVWWWCFKFYELVHFGVGIFSNGTNDLVDALLLKAIELGVDISLNTTVNKIHVANNQVQAIETNKDTFLTRRIFTNYQDNFICGKLIDNNLVSKHQKKLINNKLNNSQSLFINLGLRLNYKNLPLTSYLTYAYSSDDYAEIKENLTKASLTFDSMLIKCQNLINNHLGDDVTILNIEVLYNGDFFMKRMPEMTFIDENYLLNLVVGYVNKHLSFDIYPYIDASYVLTPVKIADFTKNKSGIYLGRSLDTNFPFFANLKSKLSTENIKGLYFGNQDGIFGFTASNSLINAVFEEKIIEYDIQEEKAEIENIIDQEKEKIEQIIETQKFGEHSEEDILENLKQSTGLGKVKSILDLNLENDTQKYEKFESLASLDENIFVEDKIINDVAIEEIKQAEEEIIAAENEEKAKKLKKLKLKQVKKQKRFHQYISQPSKFVAQHCNNDWYIVNATRTSFNTIAVFVANLLNGSIDPKVALEKTKNKKQKQQTSRKLGIVVVNTEKIVFNPKFRNIIPSNKHQLKMAKLRAQKTDVILRQEIMKLLNVKDSNVLKSFDDILHIFKNQEHNFFIFKPRELLIPKRNYNRQKHSENIYEIQAQKKTMNDLIEKTIEIKMQEQANLTKEIKLENIDININKFIEKTSKKTKKINDDTFDFYKEDFDENKKYDK